ncbi:DUF1310 family protein [Bombilactobacillus thymidiniphilus]|uniref:DUF1310 domain-containing protein n=1 Tax=Bombilactobacillus thymidiniphilus TaxID=2923363 RepID=A0ABY4PFC7_9LACO|nr:DUF1310 family protein [Bombilactobacillus thymidiniphilus]UQS84262.1 DUF1310 domain-containing protein [Bombilactobacillus thymidiniphilus]
MLQWLKRYKWWLIIGSVLMIIGLIIGGIHLEEQRQAEFKQEMNQELKEHQQFIMDTFKDMRPNKNYIGKITIDYDETQHNPMGGINFYGYVNDDKSLYFHGTLNKSQDSKYEITASSFGVKLDDKLSESGD